MEGMKWLFLLGLLGGAVVMRTAADDDDDLENPKKLEFANITVEIAGKSGKFKIWRTLPSSSSGSGNSSGPTTSPVMVTMDELKEVDAGGNAVGTTGSTKHSFNSFASQDFTFSNVLEKVIPGSNVSAEYLTFEGQLKDLTSTLKMTMYIAKEDGDVILNEEVTELRAGQVKFAVELKDWEWCGCQKGQTQETGEFIDFTIEIKNGDFAPNKNNNPGSGKRPDMFDFGSGASLSLSRQVKLDGAWTEMPQGYPKLTEQGSKHKFTFRFPKFQNASFYDPTIDTGSATGSDDTGGAGVVLTSFTTILAALFLSTRQL